MGDPRAGLNRSRLANESGVIRKDWGGRVRIALIYPNTYRLGMSNLGFQVVYRLLNEYDHIVAERVFFPEDKEMSLHLETGRGLLSMESLAPLRRFHILAFSLSFENDYPNILSILDLGRIPLLAEKRDEQDPLVMAGGITTFLNPEPVAPFFDFFLIGEAEACIGEFARFFSQPSEVLNQRPDLFRKLAAQVPSVYVPSLYGVEYDDTGVIRSMTPLETGVPERVVAAHDRSPDRRIQTSCILTGETEFGDRTLIELGRGCGRSCRFCAAGYVYRPPRTHPEADLARCVEQILKEQKNLGLLSAAVSDTPGIENITRTIVESGGHFSVSSLRADSLSPELIRNLHEAGQRTIAIAPEAGSERLRHVINKHLRKEQIDEAVIRIIRTGLFSLRLYFLVGLPTETHEDVHAIHDLVKSIKHHMVKESKERGRIGRIRLSVNCFIPKPFTPFQWHPMDSVGELKKKQKWLKKAIGREGGVSVGFDVPKWAYIQTLLSVGDRRVSNILLSAHQNGRDWKKAFRHSEMNPDFFVVRPKYHEEILPWDFIDHGIRKSHLLREYELAIKEKESEVCRVGTCTRCGVCKSLFTFPNKAL